MPSVGIVRLCFAITLSFLFLKLRTEFIFRNHALYSIALLE